jgi:hypothetical protein
VVARESVQAERESVEAERSSMEAMAMPYVIVVPRLGAGEIRRAQMQTDGADWTLKLGLWNLGSVPGIVTSIRLHTGEADELLVPLSRSIPIASDGQFPADIGVADWPLAPKKGKLVIEYLHSNGRSYRTESDVVIDGGELHPTRIRGIKPLQMVRSGA